MPPCNAGGGGPPPDQDDINQMLLTMAQSSAQLTAAVASLATSQASFMRSAADADANIGLSKAHSLLNVELTAAQHIDNTVNNLNRSGISAALRDTTIKAPDDYNGVVGSDGYGPLSTLVMLSHMAPGTTTLRLSALMSSPHSTATEAEKSECSENSCQRAAI